MYVCRGLPEEWAIVLQSTPASSHIHPRPRWCSQDSRGIKTYPSSLSVGSGPQPTMSIYVRMYVYIINATLHTLACTKDQYKKDIKLSTYIHTVHLHTSSKYKSIESSKFVNTCMYHTIHTYIHSQSYQPPHLAVRKEAARDHYRASSNQAIQLRLQPVLLRQR